MQRVSAYVIGFVALVLSFLVYTKHIYILGFPDGFISELQYAQRRLAYIFIGISVVFSLYFLYLGSIGSRARIGKRFFTAVSLYLGFIVVISLVDHYYRLNLPGSRGG